MPKISPLHYRKLRKVFERAGWEYARTKGDHLIYEKDGYIRPVVIPMYRSIPAFIIQNNLRTAGITREEYFELLND